MADRARRGDRVVALSRHAAHARSLFAHLGRSVEVVAGDARFPGLWQSALESCDAIVHLAGHSTSHGRWTKRVREEIRTSRLESARRLVDGVRMATNPPRAFIVASTVAAFGDRGFEQLDDRASYGAGFLAGVMAQLESECARAEVLGMRIVALRLGSVLDAEGGLIPHAAPWFRRGCGVIPGKGVQFVPWIHWQDAVHMFDWAIASIAMRGAVNAVAPESVQWSRLANELAARCGARGVIAPVHSIPAIVLRVLLGQGAGELTASRHAVPSRATMHGFQFEFPTLARALDDCCSRWAASRSVMGQEEKLVPPRAPAAEDGLATGRGGGTALSPADLAKGTAAIHDGVLVDLDHGLSAPDGRLLPEALETLMQVTSTRRVRIGLISQRPHWELPDLATGSLTHCAQLLSGGTLMRVPAISQDIPTSVVTKCAPIPAATVTELLARLGALAPRIGLVFEHPDGFDTPEPNRLRHPQHGNPIFITRVRPIAELKDAETMRIHLVGGAEERGTVVEWLMREFVGNGILSIEAKSPWIVSVWATSPSRALAHEFALHAGLEEGASAIPVRSLTELRRAVRVPLEARAQEVTAQLVSK